MTFFAKSALALSLPSAFAALCVLAAAVGAARKGWQGLSRWLTGLAVAVGYAVGHRIVTGALSIVPHSAEEWLPLLALGAAVLSALDALPRASMGVQGAWRCVFGVAGVATLLVPSAILTPGAKMAWSVGLGAGLAACWIALDALGARQPGAVLPLAWALVATAGSAALFIAHTAAVSQLAGVLAAVTGTAFAFGLWQRQWSWAGGAAGAVTTLLFGVGVSGVFYAELPVAAAVALWLAAIAGWVRFVPACQRLPVWTQIAVQLGATAVLAGIAVGITVHKVGLPTGGY